MGMAAGSGHCKLPIVTGNWLIRDYRFRTKNISRGLGASVLATDSRVEEVGDFLF